MWPAGSSIHSTSTSVHLLLVRQSGELWEYSQMFFVLTEFWVCWGKKENKYAQGTKCVIIVCVKAETETNRMQ